MAKTSRQTATPTMDNEVVEEHSSDLEGYTVNFVTIRQDQDLAPMFVHLPDGKCQCPHWGMVTKGRLTISYADRHDVIEAGDVFYAPPGHTPAAVAGTEFVIFSPTDLLAETDAAIAAGMQKAAG